MNQNQAFFESRAAMIKTGEGLELEVWLDALSGPRFRWAIRRPPANEMLAGQVLNKGHAESFESAWHSAWAAVASAEQQESTGESRS